MQLTEFAKAPRGPYLFDFWVHPIAIPSPLGNFSVELFPETGEPDVRMVEEASALVEFLQSQPEKVVSRVFEHYSRLLRDPNWLAACNVPADLSREDLSSFIQSRSLTVRRSDAGGKIVYENRIYVSPQWDIEHAIYLGISGNDVEFSDP